MAPTRLALHEGFFQGNNPTAHKLTDCYLLIMTGAQTAPVRNEQTTARYPATG